jgi:predicted nuclease with TOPRIM domain
MVEILGFDTPLTKLKREMDEQIAQKDALIEDLRVRLEDANEKLSRIKGTNDMLRLLLVDLNGQMTGLLDQVGSMARNVGELKARLPEIPDGL